MRSNLLATALLSASLLACGGSSGDDGGGDGGGNTITPTGPHTHYVVNKVQAPTTNDEATMFGLDIGAPKTDTPDGSVDNQLGHVLAALTGQGFDVKTTLDAAVLEGDITLLVDVQASDLTNSSAAGFQILLGDNPTPAPCGDNVGSDGKYNGSDPTADCGKQFSGGSFGIAADSPTDAVVAGTIANGTFSGGPGTLQLQLALGGTTPVNLTLHNARVKAESVSATGIPMAQVAGALSMTDLDSQVIPAIQAQLAPIIARDCTSTDGSATPPCGCADGSTGQTIIGLFDGDLTGTTKDCMVSVDEILGNTLIKSLLAPDVCSMATCATPDSLSLGVQVSAVPATYTVTGETN